MQAVIRYQEFVNWKVSTSYEQILPETASMQFPIVTICPYSRMFVNVYRADARF